MKWRSASSVRQFRLVNQTLRMDQVAEFWRTRRVREGTGSFSSASAAFGAAGPIHLGHPGLGRLPQDLICEANDLDFSASLCDWEKCSDPSPERRWIPACVPRRATDP